MPSGTLPLQPDIPPSVYHGHVAYDARMPSLCPDYAKHEGHRTQSFPEIPFPLAYSQHLSYSCSQSRYNDSNVYVVEEYDSGMSTKTTITEVASLDKDSMRAHEEELPKRKRHHLVLIFLVYFRVYVRVLAALIMVTSLSLVLTAVILFEKAQHEKGHSLDKVPMPSETITDFPCMVFSGVAFMNLAFSITLLCLSSMSSKVCPRS
jgi:hypothetical protein